MIIMVWIKEGERQKKNEIKMKRNLLTFTKISRVQSVVVQKYIGKSTARNGDCNAHTHRYTYTEIQNRRRSLNPHVIRNVFLDAQCRAMSLEFNYLRRRRRLRPQHTHTHSHTKQTFLLLVIFERNLYYYIIRMKYKYSYKLSSFFAFQIASLSHPCVI